MHGFHPQLVFHFFKMKENESYQAVLNVRLGYQTLPGLARFRRVFRTILTVLLLFTSSLFNNHTSLNFDVFYCFYQGEVNKIRVKVLEVR